MLLRIFIFLLKIKFKCNVYENNWKFLKPAIDQNKLKIKSKAVSLNILSKLSHRYNNR